MRASVTLATADSPGSVLTMWATWGLPVSRSSSVRSSRRVSGCSVVVSGPDMPGTLGQAGFRAAAGAQHPVELGRGRREVRVHERLPACLPDRAAHHRLV